MSAALLRVGEADGPVVPDAEVHRRDDEDAEEDADDGADCDVGGLDVALAGAGLVAVW